MQEGVRALQTVKGILPEGSLLAEPAWERRHRAVVYVALAEAAFVSFVALVQGYGVPHSVAEAVPIAALAALGCWPRLGRTGRSAATSLALVTAAALLVHVWAGQIEAHFLFFVNLSLLTIYQDWLPFLLALGYVVLHHGMAGVLEPEAVYSHASGQQHPWEWALVHGGFVLATCVANVLCWRLSEQALREPLTGLPGRALLLHRLRSLRSERRRRPLAVLFIDLDHFKFLNDSRGHAAGDELLSAVAQRLRHSIRPGDTVARMGGDEFAVICVGVSDDQLAHSVGERLRLAIARPFEIDGETVVTTASVGIAVAAADEEADILLAEADAAMYRSKASGGDSTSVYDREMRERIVERHRVEHGLRHALLHGELETHYQPMVALVDGAPVGVEALVRWRHPTAGMIPPGRFIPVAEACGLIEPVGELVLRRACTEIAAWNRAHPDLPDRNLSVNLSGRQLSRPGLAAVMASALEESGLDPTRLCLEITESVRLETVDDAESALVELKQLGVSLALDDFGTRLLLSLVPEADAARRGQDRPRLHLQPRLRPLRRGDRARRARHGRLTRDRGGGGGCRDGSPGRASAGPRLSAGAGLPVRAARTPRGARHAAGRPGACRCGLSRRRPGRARR